MSNKYEKEYLKLVRTEPEPPPEDCPIQVEGLLYDDLRGKTLKDRLRWRGVDTKSMVLALGALTIMASSIVLITLTIVLGLIS